MAESGALAKEAEKGSTGRERAQDLASEDQGLWQLC